MPKKAKFEKFNFNGLECEAKIVDVYDGDTITAEVDLRHLMKKFYHSEKDHKIIDSLPYHPIYPHLRMAGYNSAEVSRCTAEEKEIGLKAKQFMHDLVFEKQVWCHFLAKGEGQLIKLKSEDPYGRPITDLYLMKDGKKDIYVNKLMIDSGHAAHYDGRGEKKYKEDTELNSGELVEEMSAMSLSKTEVHSQKAEKKERAPRKKA